MADDLEQVVAFLNTLEVDGGSDDLGDRSSAGHWFAEQGLIEAGEGVSDAHLETARALRTALRALAAANHDQRPDPEAAALFTEIARGLPLYAVADAAAVRLRPAGNGLPAALAHIVATVAEASALGTWTRTKVCAAETCRWAFVDSSKNRSRRWCAMGVCGNRQKTRAYRERHRERSP